MSDFPNNFKLPENDPLAPDSPVSADAADDEFEEEIEDVGEYRQAGSRFAEPQEERKNPYNNPKNHLITAGLLILMMLLMIFADSMKHSDEQRTARENGLIDVITLTDAHLLSGGGKIGYYTLADGRLYDAEAFDPSGCERFVSRAFLRTGSTNLLTDRRIYPDADMDEYPDIDDPVYDPNFEYMLTSIESLEQAHQISHIRFFRTEGHYFACVDRSAEIWTQYVLYYYSPEHHVIFELAVISGQDIAAIRVRENLTEIFNER